MKQERELATHYDKDTIGVNPMAQFEARTSYPLPTYSNVGVIQRAARPLSDWSQEEIRIAIEEAMEEQDWDRVDELELYEKKKPGQVGKKEAKEDDEEYDPHGDWDPTAVPRSQYQSHNVDGTDYKFYNHGDGSIEFTTPSGSYPPIALFDRVNIDQGDGTIKGVPGRKLLKQPKHSNYWHFKAANALSSVSNRSDGRSPDNKTWHHHKTKGQMELVDRAVHAKFMHIGGKSMWGTA